jgi:hypothetical protein
MVFLYWIAWECEVDLSCTKVMWKAERNIQYQRSSNHLFLKRTSLAARAFRFGADPGRRNSGTRALSSSPCTSHPKSPKSLGLEGVISSFLVPSGGVYEIECWNTDYTCCIYLNPPCSGEDVHYHWKSASIPPDFRGLAAEADTI